MFGSMQSALAVRRQRNRQDKKRREGLNGKAAARRSSSTLSFAASRGSGNSPRPSIISVDGRPYYSKGQIFRFRLGRLSCSRGQRKHDILQTKVAGQVTMFHIGVVFVLFGTVLIITSLIPGHVKDHTWDELLGTGCFLAFLGSLLTVIHKMVSQSEEKQLTNYVHRRLAKSSSSHIQRDPESGEVRLLQNGPMSSSSSAASQQSNSGKIPELTIPQNGIVGVHEKSALKSPVSPSLSGEPVLDKIVEENETEGSGNGDDAPTDESTSPQETKNLLKKC